MFQLNPPLTRLLPIALGLTLAACSQVETPLQPTNTGDDNGIRLPSSRSAETPDQVLATYAQYRAVLTAIEQNDDIAPAQFLAGQRQDSAMSERVRNNWLKKLGQRGQWGMFQQHYAQLSPAAIDQEVRCYHDVMQLQSGRSNADLAATLAADSGRLAAGCNQLIAEAAAKGNLSPAQTWQRVRTLLANNQVTEARRLSGAIGQPLPAQLGGSNDGTSAGQEAALFAMTHPDARKAADIGYRIQTFSGSLKPEQIGFAYGVAGHTQALNQNMETALALFKQADPKQLSDTQWEWYARSALRLQRWGDLSNIIGSMPKHLRQNETWQYWLGRSLSAQGHSANARQHYEQAARSGRNFYALLATEALGGKVDTRNNVSPATATQVQQIARDGAIARAMTLFQASQNAGDWNMRRDAQNEWRFANREFNESTLLAAAQWAAQNEFNEMAIYSADRTNHKLNYQLRYLSPFHDTTTRYAGQVGVDPAWVYGLIRQESRFMMGARSHVGASGLMQLMPATAREVARKIGLSDADLHDIDHNIQMGTWYLADVNRSLGHEVLATAGYNAGPARARRWQANVPLEGAIYAETIPFDETRDYVKKVMANATYYASLFNEPQTSLTRRMGIIPAR